MNRRGSPEEDFASASIAVRSAKRNCTLELLRPRNDEAEVKSNPNVRRGWLQEAGRVSVLSERDGGGGESGDDAAWWAMLALAAVAAPSANRYIYQHARTFTPTRHDGSLL